MSIKEDPIYPIYLIYLESKNMTKGAFNLARISEDFFNQFIHRY
jgi:hypothetical protein